MALTEYYSTPTTLETLPIHRTFLGAIVLFSPLCVLCNLEIDSPCQHIVLHRAIYDTQVLLDMPDNWRRLSHVRYL